ncbi:MAG: GtrA family protein [Clostridia bacterium]|nr:GtrA family protein [Clostridia bacterium]
MEKSNGVLIIPSLEPDERLVTVIQGVKDYFGDIIVVNEGSGADYDEVFSRVVEILGDKAHYLVHENNLGKGRALKTAFAYFKESGLIERYDGVITADGDGQHAPDDIIMLDNQLGQNKSRALHIGSRDLSSKVMPFRSKFGNKINAFLFRFLYGVVTPDTQSGLRAISSDLTDWLLSIKGDRFEYEMQMLIETKKAGVKIHSHPIATRYEKQHKSHFKTFTDAYKVTKVLFSGMAKFIFAELVAGIFDLGAFYFIDYIVIGNRLPVATSLLISTAGARTISSVANFLVNRFITFAGKKIDGTSVLKYYALWLVQLGASYGLVLAFTSIWGGGEIFIKIVVDFILSLVSYKVQQAWVFGGKNGKK